DFSEFDRKNYFYPDIPKGYQISQYKYPLVSGGSLAGVAVTRVHLEEDTARSEHKNGYSLLDFNRSGVPLMELVTEPVIKDAETAVAFAKELQLLLWYLGASDANMERGEMRVEANVSVSSTDAFGTKVEVKNLNSFRSVSRAIYYEIERQIAVIEAGGEVVQETRGWDEMKGKTFSQRKKESSHDYRYFPEPDLPKLKLSEVLQFQELALPELPNEKRARYDRDFGLKAEDREMYIRDAALAGLFEGAMAHIGKESAVLVSNYITSDLAGLMRGSGGDTIPPTITHRRFAALMEMAAEKKISSRGAKDILAEMFIKGGDPEKIAGERGLLQKSDEGELLEVVRKIIGDNPKVVADYKGGKELSIQFFVGQGMKATKGGANPEVLKKLLIEALAKQ
ncbi:Asp-tRNA(Asn)/Glu-tRNA(Gln) amidotransferase subunit GatB, partial [bacterium]|nr:Asp-tRNA(Asn)/Glu-tRNA(Gln) amidotransferase subunit GatB [bacterium]